MRTLRFVAKAAPVESQIIDRINRGFEYVELQLVETNTDPGDIVELIDKYSDKIKVVGVHSPIVHTKHPELDCVNLECISNRNVYNLLKYSFTIANKIGELYQTPDIPFTYIPVIVHTSFSELQWEYYSSLTDSVFRIMNNLMFDHPHVSVSIENVIPTYNNLRMSNGFFFEDVVVAKEKLQDAMFESFRDRVACTFDTCHSWISEAVIRALRNRFPGDGIVSVADRGYYFLEDIVKFNKHIERIHVASCKGMGSGKGRHGCSLADEGTLSRHFISVLYETLNKLPKNKKVPYIVLEVTEDDYESAVSTEESRDLIIELFKEFERKEKESKKLSK